jgi:hypothetical protein
VSDFDFLWTAEERKDGSFDKTNNASRVHNFYKCHRNISKQTNPLQVNDLIKNKSLFLQIQTIFKNIMR